MSALTELCRQLADCDACGLAQQRTQVVPGEGAEDADIIFIGEAPGYNEDRLGRPFVGQAGAFLDELLALVGLSRKDVYIANVVKCRPPGNRDPLPGEILACKPWLDRQLEVIRPKVVVTLGRFSLARFLPNESIGKVHGRARQFGDIVCFPMYHPAAALHQGSLRKIIEEDMQRLPDVLKECKGATGPERPDDDGGRQLALF
jgi:uracil-DNA glycosylase family 4